MTNANHITIVSVRTYLWVFAALLVLMVATIVAAELHLGILAPVIALAIAIAKAVLVVLIFMHIRYSSPMMRIFAAAGLLWFAILMGLTLTDYFTRLGPPFILNPNIPGLNG